jgi:hypothetical protein
MVLVSALKCQLKCEMYTEAQLVSERSDEILLSNNMAQKHPGLLSYVNYRLKVIHSVMLEQFSAFNKSSEPVEI